MEALIKLEQSVEHTHTYTRHNKYAYKEQIHAYIHTYVYILLVYIMCVWKILSANGQKSNNQMPKL